MYEVRLMSPAEKFFKKLERSNQQRLMKKLSELENNPRIGIPLTGNLAGLWKLRIGDYRAIYQIKDNELLVLVLRLGHRKNIYD
jgi:mRNA interferase RelE/StbE